ncbi:DUF6082 family protein [Amycolatopsis sp. lyj-23]|uniref:DUF6082 family protein n=1 Tax=Amycolatopsis sp. lyj-23 TaxID=2789283 RepID=UPI00397BD622
MFLSGQYSLQGVRRNIARFFEGELEREYWAYSRDSWLSGQGGGRRRQSFLSAVEEEFHSARKAGPPADWVPLPPTSSVDPSTELPES